MISRKIFHILCIAGLMAIYTGEIMAIEGQLTVSTDKFVDAISKISGYKVNLIGTLPNNKTGNFNYRDSLSNTIKSYLDGLDLIGYVIDINKKNKLVRIIIPTQQILLDEQESRAHRDVDLMVFDGITPEKVKEIKENNRIAMEMQTDDTVIYPTPDDNSGITIGEIKRVKDNYKRKLDEQTDEDEILPESEYGRSFTRGEINYIKDEYYKKLASQTGDNVIYVTPDDYTGITLQQIDFIKNFHNEREKSEAIEITPSPIYPVARQTR